LHSSRNSYRFFIHLHEFLKNFQWNAMNCEDFFPYSGIVQDFLEFLMNFRVFNRFSNFNLNEFFSSYPAKYNPCNIKEFVDRTTKRGKKTFNSTFCQTKSAADFFFEWERVALTHIKQQQCVWQFQTNALFSVSQKKNTHQNTEITKKLVDLSVRD
jgi:hypothetical protein